MTSNVKIIIRIGIYTVRKANRNDKLELSIRIGRFYKARD